MLESYTYTLKKSMSANHTHAQKSVHNSTINYFLFSISNITMIKCNLCGQEFEDDDSLIKERKIRHQEHHNGSLYRPSANIIRGKVKWLHFP